MVDETKRYSVVDEYNEPFEGDFTADHFDASESFNDDAYYEDIPAKPEFTLFEKIASAFELTGSLSRELIQQGATSDDFDPSQFAKIISGDKRTTANDFKNWIQDKYEVDLELGDDELIEDKIGNFMIDLGLDVVTDPLGGALVSVPFKSVKGLHKMGVLGKLTRSELRLLGGAATGAAAGAAGREPGEDQNILMDIAGGAVLGFAGIGTVNALKRFGPGISDGAYNMYLKASRPALYENILKKSKMTPAAAKRTAKAFTKSPEARKLKRSLFNSRVEILKKLDDTGGDDLVATFTDVRDEAFRKTIAIRKQKMDAIEFLNDKQGNKYRAAWDQMTEQANTDVGKWVDDHISNMPNAEILRESFDKYRITNRKLIDEYRTYAKAKGFKMDGKNIEVPNIPIDFHTASIIDVDAKKLFKLLPEDLVKQGMKQRHTGKLGTGGESIDAMGRELLSAEKLMGNLADKGERAARKIMAQVYSTNPERGLFKTFESGLETYDNFLRFIKKMHLTFTHSWIQNNYIDNTLRAYVLDKNAAAPMLAMETALKSNPVNYLNKNSMYREMLDTLSPVTDLASFKPIKGELGLAQDLGVIDDNFFRDIEWMANENYGELMARFGKERADVIFNKMRSRGHLAKIADTAMKPLDLVTGFVRDMGSASENTTRMLAFRQFYKTYLDEAPKLKKIFESQYGSNIEEAFTHSEGMRDIFKRASKSVNDTFFDYGNVEQIESSVMKRIFPYWTFFSRNFDFWTKQFVENTGSVNRILKMQANVGRPLTEEERMGVPDWLLANGARFGERTPDGLTLATVPNLSINDAITLLDVSGGELDKEALNKISPIIKAVAENVRGREFFLDQPISNREGVRGRGKRVFSQGLPGATVAQSLGMGQAPLDDTGRMNTKEEDISRIANLQANLLPLPIVSNIMQMYNEVQYGKTVGESIVKRGPKSSRLVKELEETKNRRNRINKRGILDGFEDELRLKSGEKEY